MTTTTTTWGDVAAAAAPVDSPEAAPEKARVHARMRARGYRSLPVAGKVGDLARTAGADLRSAWWTPASLPTLAQAWAERMPDRDRVPGNNAVLYRGWVAYNHSIALAVPALALVVVGLLTPVVFAARHPARLGLAVVISIPLIVLLAR